MPLYTYRREDGTTFDYRQKFTDDPLTVDPQTGQHVVRVVQAAGIIFKGSGFYVNDSKSASKSNIATPAKSADASESKPATESSSTTPAPTTEAAKPAEKAKPAPAAAAAD